MRKYHFFPKHTSEPIGVCEASSIREAEEFFTRLKNLSLESFLSIYSVEEVEKENSPEKINRKNNNDS